MGLHVGGSDLLVLRHDLQAFAWSAPMRELAAKVGMSDVGLKKLLAARGILSPPQGYWNRKAAGKPVPVYPQPEPRGPGETGRVEVHGRFAQLLSPAPPMSSAGPFASDRVPECLEQLYEQELVAIGRSAGPRSLDRPHTGLLRLLEQEKRRAGRSQEAGWDWDGPIFASPLGKRRLRLLNDFLYVLGDRGHLGIVSENGGELNVEVKVGDTPVSLELGLAGRCAMVHRNGRLRAAPDLPAATPLRFSLFPDFDVRASEAWQDDASGTLETKLAVIAAATIVAGEAKFRQGLRDQEELLNRERAQAAERRQLEIRKLHEERLQALRASSDLLHQAEQIRAVIRRVRAAFFEGQLGIDRRDWEGWERWATAEADRLDPVSSGQVLSHIQPMAARTAGEPTRLPLIEH
jgi:hypothetical protein